MNTILVVDDEPTNLETVSLLLRLQGYEVLKAADGKEATEISKRHHRPIQLLVADLALRTVSGTDVAMELVESWPEMAVLFMSGTPLNAWEARDRYIFDSLQPNAVDFLEKPFVPRALTEKVCRLIQRASSGGSVGDC